MAITVDDVLKKPFILRSHEEKLKIIAEDKPKPILNVPAVVSVKSETEGGSLLTHQFSLSLYEDIQWLAGCEKRSAFFCWPCLLFKSPSRLWNSTGVTDISYLAEGVAKHEESTDHIQATLQYQKYLEEAKLQPSNFDFTEFNELVKRNREIFKRFTDVVCNLLVNEQYFYERKCGCQLNSEACVKNLLYLRAYDVLNCNYIEDAVDLIKICPNIVNELVDAIAKIVKLAVRKEVLASTYVSVILSDHSKISNKAQISTVLRYIKDGKVCERYVGFLNMGDQKNLAQIHQHINNVLLEFGIVDKLLAVSIDGGILPTSVLARITVQSLGLPEPVVCAENIIEAMYPNAFLVPWYCHGVEYVLQQCLMVVKECNLFFKTMNAMKQFFNKKSNRYILESFMTINLPSTRNTKWFVRSQFISVINKYRKYFVIFFESILQNSVKWDAEDVTKVSGFQQILENFDTIFLLHAFTKIFEIVSPLSKSVKCSAPDDFFSINVATYAIRDLCIEHETKFEDLWSQIHNENALEPELKKTKPDLNDPKIPTYRELYKSIIKRLIQEIQLRFVKLTKLNFCQLLFCDKQGHYRFTAPSHGHFKMLENIRGSTFDKELVRNELYVIQASVETFSQKTVYELYEFLIQMKLKSAFKGVFKLCELILTLPLKPPSKDFDVSKFEEIKDWSYISDALGIQSGDISIPCIEIDYLQELKKSSNFHSDVAAIFYDANKTLELMEK